MAAARLLSRLVYLISMHKRDMGINPTESSDQWIMLSVLPTGALVSETDRKGSV